MLKGRKQREGLDARQTQEWLELQAIVFAERMRARNEAAREIIARSRQQIEKSKELLRAEVPRHGRPKKEE